MAQGYIGQNQIDMDSSNNSDEIKIGDIVVWKTDKKAIQWTVINVVNEDRILVREHGKDLQIGKLGKNGLKKLTDLKQPTKAEVTWAAKTLLNLANVTATQKEIDVFYNDPQGNSRWIKAVVAKAQPQTGGGNGNAYNKSVDILSRYGVDCYRQPR